MPAAVALRALDLLRLPDEERTKLGVGGGEGGFVFGYNPDTVLAPDIVFVVMDRLPPPDQEGFIDVVPNLVGEGLSRGDTAAKLDKNVQRCLADGVQRAWVANPCSGPLPSPRPIARPASSSKVTSCLVARSSRVSICRWPRSSPGRRSREGRPGPEAVQARVSYSVSTVTS